MNTYGSLAQNARSSQLKSAKIILWFLGIVGILGSAFYYTNAESEVDKEIDKELAKNGQTLAALRALPAEQKAPFEKARTEAIGKVKLAYGAGLVISIVFIGCALAVGRKPVIATVTGLVVYLGLTAVVAAVDSSTLLQGIILRVAIIIGLVSAVKTALAVERQQHAVTEHPPL